jgi:hypothetical protein
MKDPTIGIFIVDAAYTEADDSEYPEKSRQFRERLEADFRLRFNATNIGPGFDIPAYVTWFSLTPWPYVAAGLFLFFQGKRLNENIDAWMAIYSKLKSFFARKPTFQRDGAAILAVNAITSYFGRAPQSIQLLGYLWLPLGDERDAPLPLEQISEAPPEVHLGLAVHFFMIEADDQKFRIRVTDHNVQLSTLSS